MNRQYLAASLKRARWQHGFRQKRLDAAHVANDRKRIAKWSKLRRESGVLIKRRLRQLAALKPKRKPVSQGRARAVAKARSYVGVRETRRNGGGMIDVWQRRLGFGNVAWCGIFVGNMMMQAGVQGVTSRIAGVALIEQDARARRAPFRGWSSSGKAAMPGDLVCIGAAGQHVGMVTHVHPDGSVSTIEGNYSDSVKSGRRSPGEIRGIAQVNY